MGTATNHTQISSTTSKHNRSSSLLRCCAQWDEKKTVVRLPFLKRINLRSAELQRSWDAIRRFRRTSKNFILSALMFPIVVFYGISVLLNLTPRYLASLVFQTTIGFGYVSGRAGPGSQRVTVRAI